MPGGYARFLPVLLVVSVAAGPPPAWAGEGPAGPAARLPDGRVAAPPRVTAPRVSSGCPPVAARAAEYAPGRGRTVALTFDDGPGASTGQIISILRSTGVTATFFNLGENEAARD